MIARMPIGLIVAGLAYGCTPAASDRAPAADVAAVLRASPIIDGHNDLALHYLRATPPWSASTLDIDARLPGQSDVPRWRQGGFGASFVTLASDLGSGKHGHADRLRVSFDWFDALVARHGRTLMAARSPADVRRAAAEGRIALIAAIESGDQLDGSLGRLRELYARGLRAVTIVYDHHNDLGDGAMAYEQSRAVAGPAAGGLSPFGRMGNIDDHAEAIHLAHHVAAEVTATDAIAMSTAPVVFTHVNARAIADTPRNVSDDTLRRLAAKGGLVMVSFVPYLVSPAYLAWFTEGERRYAALMAAHPGDRAAIAAGMAVWDQTHPQPVVTVAEVANHIEHIARVAGDDHVGIGSDFDGMDQFVIPDVADATKVPAVFAELARRGWSATRLKKLARGNLLRVWDEVERLKR